MADIERIKQCENCPQACAFETVGEALKDPNETIRKAGELGMLLLSFQPEAPGPRPIPGKSGNSKELIVCCKQAQALPVKSIIARSHQAIKKLKAQQN